MNIELEAKFLQGNKVAVMIRCMSMDITIKLLLTMIEFDCWLCLSLKSSHCQSQTLPYTCCCLWMCSGMCWLCPLLLLPADSIEDNDMPYAFLSLPFCQGTADRIVQEWFECFQDKTEALLMRSNLLAYSAACFSL